MKNWVNFVKHNFEWTIYRIAEVCLETLNYDPVTDERYNKEYYNCDNGQTYLRYDDALEAEIEWLKQEAKNEQV